MAAAALKTLFLWRNTALLRCSSGGRPRFGVTRPIVVAIPALNYRERVSLPSCAYRRNFTIRATADSDSSSPIESPLMDSMKKKIKEHLNAESVIVKDAYGDGRHVSIEVISSAFEGQSAVNRQRMVYKAIWEELQDRVHAVDQMTTRTPFEAGSGS